MHGLLGALLLLVAMSARAGTSAEQAMPEVEALRAAAGEHRLILLGEMHGTREAPAFTGQLAAAYASKEPVILALEMGAPEQAALDRYLDSTGDAQARARLLAGEFWNVPASHNDGRRNLQVVELIEAMRRLRAEGRDVALLAMDASVHAGDRNASPLAASATMHGSAEGNARAMAHAQERDEAMAMRIRTAFQDFPRGRMLVLAGGVHAMLRRPDWAPPEMQAPMGSFLAGLEPFSVDLAAASGEFWACMDGSCGPRKLHPRGFDSGLLAVEPWTYRVVLPTFTIATPTDRP